MTPIRRNIGKVFYFLTIFTLCVSIRPAQANLIMLSDAMFENTATDDFVLPDMVGVPSIADYMASFDTFRMAMQGGVTNTTTYGYDTNAQRDILSFGFDHVFNNSSGATESSGLLTFSIAETLTYEIEGQWILNGTTDQSFVQQAFLNDETTPLSFLLRSENAFFSMGLPITRTDLQYDLGELDGEPQTSFLSGALTGELQPGTYDFRYFYSLSNGGQQLADRSANGYVNLTLKRMDSETVVPEPMSLTLFGMGSVGLFLQRKRKSSI